ncbi:MAG: outer membrane beta-barrel protein [Pseudomonadota bacterium]
MAIKKIIAATAAALVCAGTASAQDWYVSGSIGINAQSDSDNSGATDAFTTGNLGDGSTLDVAAGTDYGWKTEFDSGLSLAGEVGLKTAGGLRGGLELVYTNADVDTHTGVTLGGGSIDAVDAAALTGDAEAIGASVAAVVADGQGDITTTGIFANVYYDFDTGNQFVPYVGAGIGFVDVDVEYSPSGVGIIDDGETKFAYQLRAGAGFEVSENVEVFGEYTYRASDDIEVNNDLFPGTLDIENQQNLFSVGVRYTFGR